MQQDYNTEISQLRAELAQMTEVGRKSYFSNLFRNYEQLSEAEMILLEEDIMRMLSERILENTFNGGFSTASLLSNL